jgi:signal transduction histidine kinase/ActR/RegA family two-component response regulator
VSSPRRDERVAELEERLARLAREKASLALVTEMMASLGAESGATPAAARVLRTLIEHVGGTGAVAWVATDSGFLRVDEAGQTSRAAAIDCPVAADVFASGRSLEIETDVEETAVTEPAGESASTWVFPLGVGAERVGVVRVEALQLSAWEIGPHIGLFFRLAALLLRHEVVGESALQRAYAELEATATALARAKAELEARVAERTAELVAINERLQRELAERTRAEEEARRMDAALQASEEQLRQAQKMEALGLLAGGVAHDFNNLLQAIVGFGSVLRESAAGSDAEAVEEILAAAARATELTKNLLAFSRKQPFSPAPLDVVALVERERKLLARLIGEDITLETRTSPGPLLVDGDAAQLQQVLLNLATNARDAMPHGGRLVVWTDAVTVDGAPTARIGVSDTGVGIAAEDLARVFEPFFTTKPIGSGTGLGLSIAYGIVAKHGGRIEATSRRGEGTTFLIDLPRLAEGRLPDDSAAPAARPGRGEHLLVVEDVPTVRNVLRAILSRAGYDVTTAADGVEAVALVGAGRRFALVVLDMLMPRMNGREALERLREAVPGQRALLMSGYTADVLDARGAAALGAPLLPKPIGAAALLAAVRAEIDRAPR